MAAVRVDPSRVHGFRTLAMKTDAGRKKKIAALVEMLRDGKTFHPNGRTA